MGDDGVLESLNLPVVHRSPQRFLRNSNGGCDIPTRQQIDPLISVENHLDGSRPHHVVGAGRRKSDPLSARDVCNGELAHAGVVLQHVVCERRAELGDLTESFWKAWVTEERLCGAPIRAPLSRGRRVDALWRQAGPKERSLESPGGGIRLELGSISIGVYTTRTLKLSAMILVLLGPFMLPRSRSFGIGVTAGSRPRIHLVTVRGVVAVVVLADFVTVRIDPFALVGPHPVRMLYTPDANAFARPRPRCFLAPMSRGSAPHGLSVELSRMLEVLLAPSLVRGSNAVTVGFDPSPTCRGVLLGVFASIATCLFALLLAPPSTRGLVLCRRNAGAHWSRRRIRRGRGTHPL